MDDQSNPTNDLNAPVPKFILELEKDRRTPEGRIRNDRDFREHFFPYDESKARDRLLKFLPKDVRGPIIASWGIRGKKAASRDDDVRVLAVVHDAFVAGDIDDKVFEEGLNAETIVRWGELADFWRFWRGGKHTKYSIQRALEIGYDLGLFDARWFFDVIESGGGRLRGTDVLAEGLTKTELADWIKHIHESGDGSPKGMLAALGWPTLVAKTANPVLLAVIDAFAEKNGLVKDHFLADAEPNESEQSRQPETKVPSARSSDRKPASIRPRPPSLWTETAQRQPEPTAGPTDETPLPPSTTEEEALLRELGDSTPASEEGDWLENPIQPQGGADDLDVEIDGGLGTGRPLEPTGAIAELLHSDPDDPLDGDPEFGGPGRKGLPGLPSGFKGKRSVPPPLPDSSSPPGKPRK